MALFAAVAVTGAAVAVSHLLWSCNTQGCTDNRSALPMMGFYSKATGSQIMLDSLELGGIGAPDDSLLIAKGQSRAWVYLPFVTTAARHRFASIMPIPVLTARSWMIS